MFMFSYYKLILVVETLYGVTPFSDKVLRKHDLRLTSFPRDVLVLCTLTV